MIPDTRYARSGDLHIAYQVIGDGSFDLVFVPGFISNIEHFWEDPVAADFLRRLASFSRLILFDKRGTGLSDRVGGLPNLDDRMDDVRAVMEAVGSSRAALLGVSEGGAMATLFAATYPDRVSALVLYGSYPHHGLWVVTPEQFDAVLKKMDSTWGTDHRVRYFVPGRASDEAFKRWWSRFERLGASPSAAIALMKMNSEIDIRDILPSVRVPTLVLNRAGDLLVNAEAGRYLRDHIPGAKYVELPGNDHWMWAGETNRLADEIEEFLTGTRTTTEPDRVLATVLFTDIVNSTTRARELGDRKWRELLDQHNQVIRRELVRFRGREVKTLGDGFLATFDGPARAIRFAQASTRAVSVLGLDIRCGLHTGEVEVLDDDVSGIAVHIASRVANLAKANEVIVSSTVRDLVAGSNITFGPRQNHRVKGLEEEIRVFSVQEA